MPYDPKLIAENNASRERLRALLERLTDEQYNLPLDTDWTIGSTLAHIALFDKRAIEILDLWEKQGVAPSPNDPDIINAALLPFLRELPPAAIKQLSLEFAETLDAKLITLPDAVIDQFVSVGDHPFNLTRAKHRNEHFEQIEQALNRA